MERRKALSAPADRRPRLALLDRDGVLNVDVGYAYRPEQLAFIDGAPAAVRRLNEAGWLVVVVTNQSGIARGLYDESLARRGRPHIGLGTLRRAVDYAVRMDSLSA